MSPSRTRLIATLILLLAAASALTYSLTREKNPASAKQWYYDLGSAQLFAAAPNQTPPITAPSGKEGVLAVVIACGNCADPAQRQTAYLQKWNPDALAHLGKDASQIPANIIMDPVVALPAESPTWQHLNSPAGQRITTQSTAALQQRCPDTFTRCTPN